LREKKQIKKRKSYQLKHINAKTIEHITEKFGLICVSYEHNVPSRVEEGHNILDFKTFYFLKKN